jgi:hypothetical protein
VSEPFPPSGGDDERPTGPEQDVDYRAVPTPFASLSPGERRVAWAVVRPLATAAWWAGAALALAWVATASNGESFRESVRLVHGLPAFVALVVAGVLEYYARALRAGGYHSVQEQSLGA